MLIFIWIIVKDVRWWNWHHLANDNSQIGNGKSFFSTEIFWNILFSLFIVCFLTFYFFRFDISIRKFILYPFLSNMVHYSVMYTLNTRWIHYYLSFTLRFRFNLVWFGFKFVFHSMHLFVFGRMHFFGANQK